MHEKLKKNSNRRVYLNHHWSHFMHQMVELNIHTVIKRRNQNIEIYMVYHDIADIEILVIGHNVQPYTAVASFLQEG